VPQWALRPQVYHEYVSGAIAPFGLDFDVAAHKRRELYGMIVGAFEKNGLLASLVRVGSAAPIVVMAHGSGVRLRLWCMWTWASWGGTGRALRRTSLHSL
jgi:hypothetical protein